VPDFATEPFVEIGRRLEMRADHSWIGILSADADPAAACDDLVAELQAFLQVPARVVPIKPVGFSALREALHQPENDAVILFAGAGLDASDWSSLDLMRSALERPGPVVLWMAPDSVAQLTESAPNIRSFIGSSIFVAGPDGGIMTDEERQRRLQELREHYRTGDEEIVRRAESKELPAEPEFVEWLVLLGRGDLV
jgi:hypothetical protein